MATEQFFFAVEAFDTGAVVQGRRHPADVWMIEADGFGNIGEALHEVAMIADARGYDRYDVMVRDNRTAQHRGYRNVRDETEVRASRMEGTQRIVGRVR